MVTSRLLSIIALCLVCVALRLTKNQSRWNKDYLQHILPPHTFFAAAPQQESASSSQQIINVSVVTPTGPEFLFPYHINNHTDSFTPGEEHRESEICFIKSSYATSVAKSDRVDHSVFDVTEFQVEFPSFRFYMFTNLEDLHPPGWTKIVTPNLPYNRFITHSRYGKFLAWLLPEIRACGVVFYVDGHVQIVKNPILLRDYARRTLQSPSGLMQFKHPYSSPEGSGYGPVNELDLILRCNKDIAQNIDASIQWFEAQEDFDNAHTPVYANTYFGYDPKNPHYQTLSLKFWERYSLELDSWRDQPLWSYLIKKQNITPAPFPSGLFPENRYGIFPQIKELQGHGGHMYSAESNADARPHDS